MLGTESHRDYSKLRWHCRRGVKELDVVLSRYLEFHYKQSDSDQQKAFKSLLELEDPKLMALIFDDAVLQDKVQQSVLNIMKQPYSPQS